MQNLHTGPFDIYAPLPFTFCIRANDVGNGVVPFPAFALTALGLVLDLACTNGDKVRLVNQFFHWRNIVKVVVAGNSVQQGGSQGGVAYFFTAVMAIMISRLSSGRVRVLAPRMSSSYR